MSQTLWLAISLVVCIILFLGYISVSILFYRKKVSTWNSIVTKYQNRLDQHPTIAINERISSAKELFSLIDTLVEYEIISDREYEILLQKKSSRIDIEDAVTRISTGVFNNINASVFDDVNNIVTRKCLMSYIQRRTFVEYFIYLQKNNEGME